MEGSEWSEDTGYPGAPLPPHERVWRHPSEIGQAVWVQSEPTVSIGRRLFSMAVIGGTVVAAGVTWAMLSTSPGSGMQRHSALPLPPPVSATIIFLEQPTNGHGRQPDGPTPPTIEGWSANSTPANSTPANQPIDSGAAPEPTNPTTLATPSTPSITVPVPADSRPTSETSEASVPAPTAPLASNPEQNVPEDPSTLPSSPQLDEMMVMSTEDEAVAVPILDGHLAVMLGDNVPEAGEHLRLSLDGRAHRATVMFNGGEDVLAIVHIDNGTETGAKVGEPPLAGTEVVVDIRSTDGTTTDRLTVATVLTVGQRQLTVDGECPALGVVRTTDGDLIGLCTGVDGVVATLGTSAEMIETISALIEQAQADQTGSGNTSVPTAETTA